MQIVSPHETRKFADWSELIPLLLRSRQHLSVEDFSEAVLAVAQAAERKDITEEESKLLLSHLASALLGYELNSIIGGLAVGPDRRRGYPRLMSGRPLPFELHRLGYAGFH